MGPGQSIAELTQFATRLADLARAETAPRFRANGAVTNKVGAKDDRSDFDPVTEADRQAERVMRDAIEARYPEHGILGEEFGYTNQGASERWVLDPVDGTRAFVCGAATWTTLIAFEQAGAPAISVIDQPYTNERWVSSEGATRFLRGADEHACAVSEVKRLSEARLSTTDPRASAYFNDAEAAAFAEIADRARLVRFSFDAYGYGLLALGQLDLIIEAGLAHYDYAALEPIVTGAGGVVTDWSGGAFSAEAGGQIIAAATPELHAEAMRHLTPARR
ncbi:MAG: inositol monophosphatase family protein [Pseudomonadota bacterium]